MSCLKTIFRVIFIIEIFSSCLFEIIVALNIDLSKVVIYQGTKGSMFGYTVAGYKQNGKTGVIIGAPKNRDKQFSTKIPQYEGGSLYFCKLDHLDLFGNKNRNSKCEEIKFPISSSSSPLAHIEQQWLGASLVTSKSDGSVVVCAPRLYLMDTNVDRSNGICYYSKQRLTNFIKYMPDQRDEGTYHIHPNFNSQAGFSLTLSKDSKTFYSGAVSVFVHQANGILASGCLLEMNMDKGRDIKIFNPVHDKWTYGSYFGYATTSLNFYGTNITGVAVTAPKAELLRGKVVILTSSFSQSNSKDLIGEQFAAYFGYSICTSDVDGDGADDLIVGAPMYSHNFNSVNELYESGRIYVYYQGKVECSRHASMCWDERFNRFDYIDGEHSKGRFGHTIAALEDVNRDGIDDIAVSAPYEESSENCHEALYTGAVYIYLGSQRGISKKYSNVLKASEVYHQIQMKTLSIKSFGFSLHGGVDLDGNSIPDLVIGAYESDFVFVFFI